MFIVALQLCDILTLLMPLHERVELLVSKTEQGYFCPIIHFPICSIIFFVGLDYGSHSCVPLIIISSDPPHRSAVDQMFVDDVETLRVRHNLIVLLISLSSVSYFVHRLPLFFYYFRFYSFFLIL